MPEIGATSDDSVERGPDRLDRLLAEAFRPWRLEAPLEPPPDRRTAGHGIGAEGRYEIMGEVGRGGMGIILRGRDRSFDRDVAIKMLHDRLTGDPAQVRRFEDEARIGGRLQHPGIVPVHDLGRDAVGRPFFAMKLVEGETLSALLGRRTSPSDERHRFLVIFEQISQTVAYAHARGIVHRDLKPLNVMVGSFGEVLVMDWGLAKVVAADGDVARSPTSEPVAPTSRQSWGVVMGTPPYMAPEQARGDAVRVDERVDVFALGAILCEILTGAPPFVDIAPAAALARSAAGDLAATRERLAAVHADREIVDLCRSCLDPDPGQRPTDGAAVARTAGAHLQSVEERRRAAEIAVAEERARSAEALAKAAAERRARHLGVGLAILVVVAVLAAWAGVSWLDHRDAARIAAVERGVLEAKEEAIARSSEARAMAAPDGTRWASAEAAVRRAGQLASAPGVATRLVEEVHALAVQIEGEARVARALEAQQAQDRAMVERLERLRLDSGVTWDWKECADRSATAFAEYGIDAAMDVGAIVARIRGSAIRRELATGVQDWSFSVKMHRGTQDAAWRRLADVIVTMDPDPIIAAARRVLLFGDTAARQAAVASPDSRRLPTDLFLGLADQVGYEGHVEDAVAAYRQVVLDHPEDFWVNFQLAFWLTRLPSPEPQEALRYFTVAVSLAPRSAITWCNLGATLVRSDRRRDAVRALERAVELDPACAVAHLNLGVLRDMSGDWEGALVRFRLAIEVEPGHVMAHVRLAMALADHDRAEEAVSVARRAVELDPRRDDAQDALGWALFRNGEVKEAQRVYVELRPRVLNESWFLKHYAAVERKAGDLLEAINAWWHLTRVDPSQRSAYGALSRATQSLDLPERNLSLWQDVLTRADGIPEAHLGLAAALLQCDRPSEALAQLERAEDLVRGQVAGATELVTWLAVTRRMAEIEGSLASFIDVDPASLSPADRATVARLCAQAGRHHEAARFFLATFADPETTGPNPQASRRQAAAAAIQASLKDATGAPTPDGATWRRHALEWLRADLADLERRAEDDADAADAQIVRIALEQRLDDAALAPIRDAKGLAALPAAERAEWESYWRAVAELMAEVTD